MDEPITISPSQLTSDQKVHLLKVTLDAHGEHADVLIILHSRLNKSCVNHLLVFGKRVVAANAHLQGRNELLDQTGNLQKNDLQK